MASKTQSPSERTKRGDSKSVGLQLLNVPLEIQYQIFDALLNLPHTITITDHTILPRCNISDNHRLISTPDLEKPEEKLPCSLTYEYTNDKGILASLSSTCRNLHSRIDTWYMHKENSLWQKEGILHFPQMPWLGVVNRHMTTFKFEIEGNEVASIEAPLPTVVLSEIAAASYDIREHADDAEGEWMRSHANGELTLSRKIAFILKDEHISEEFKCRFDMSLLPTVSKTGIEETEAASHEDPLASKILSHVATANRRLRERTYIFQTKCRNNCKGVIEELSYQIEDMIEGGDVSEDLRCTWKWQFLAR